MYAGGGFGQNTDQSTLESDDMLGVQFLYPMPSASLGVDFSPDPVYSDNSSCPSGDPPSWYYDVYISETSGVGLFVDSFTIDYYDMSGNYLSTGYYTAEEFAEYFSDCQSGSAYLPPFGLACGDLCTNLGGRFSGAIVFTFYGHDANANSVSFGSTTLYLLYSGRTGERSEPANPGAPSTGGQVGPRLSP
jgi:hypothetical protein